MIMLKYNPYWDPKDLAEKIVTGTIESDVKRGTDEAWDLIFELIKALDLEMAEWEFTKRVADHFQIEVGK